MLKFEIWDFYWKIIGKTYLQMKEKFIYIFIMLLLFRDVTSCCINGMTTYWLLICNVIMCSISAMSSFKKSNFKWQYPIETIMWWTELHTHGYLSCLVTKPTKWHVCPAKTQISLGIREAAHFIWNDNKCKFVYAIMILSYMVMILSFRTFRSGQTV